MTMEENTSQDEEVSVEEKREQEQETPSGAERSCRKSYTADLPTAETEKAPEGGERDGPCEIPKEAIEKGVNGRILIEEEGYEPMQRSGSHAVQNRRAHMEDRHICIDDLARYTRRRFDTPGPVGLYAVFDGHRGHKTAEWLKNNFVHVLINNELFPSDVYSCLKQLFHVLDSMLHNEGVQGGACAIVAVLVGSNVYVANAGDCRAFIARGDFIRCPTIDHKARNEVRRVKHAGGHVGRHGYLCAIGGRPALQVSRCLGDWENKEGPGLAPGLISDPDVFVLGLKYEDEFMILASDGLFDVLPNQVAKEIAKEELYSNNEPQACAEELVLAAMAANSHDNITVLVVCF